MSALTVEQAEEVLAGWRSGHDPVAGWENPAGLLFPGGEYAEAEMIALAADCSALCTAWSCTSTNTEVIVHCV